MPKALGEDFGLVIIDEAFWQDGLATKAKLDISGLAHELNVFPVRDVYGFKDHYFTSQLRGLIGQLQHALSQMPDGYVTRQQLVDAGLSAEDCEEAVKLEWARKVDHNLRPGAAVEAHAADGIDQRRRCGGTGRGGIHRMARCTG